jgi:DNA-binding CsgD family transcriptional regulator
MSTGLNGSQANGSVISYFDEAVQVIHLQWENQNDFAAAVAETLRALFTADAVYVGSIDITTGIRQPIVNDLLAELDPQSSRWLQTTIERLTLAFEQRARDARVTQPNRAVDRWTQGNPYANLSRAIDLGDKLGALVPLWEGGTLVDFFVTLSGKTQSRQLYLHTFDRLIPHLEIAVSRVWRLNQPPSPERLLKRLRNSGLTGREVEVVSWLLQGKTNPEIATIIGVSVQTVKNHLGSVYPKLGVENRAAAFVHLADLLRNP